MSYSWTWNSSEVGDSLGADPAVFVLRAIPRTRVSLAGDASFGLSNAAEFSDTTG